MSAEMFWWLKAHHDAVRNPTDEVLKEGISDVNSDSAIRCIYAATRIYRPKMTDTLHSLSAYGASVAEKVVATIEASDEDPMTYPQRLPVENNFIQCVLTWRAVGLLHMTYAALYKAQVERFDYLQKHGHLPPNPIMKHKTRKADKADKNSMSEKELEREQEFGFGNPILEKHNKLDIYEENEPIVHAIQIGANSLAVYVPAVSLGTGTGRVDWRELTKYGLLDVRTVHDGARGRAKLGLTVSDVGKRLIKDLGDSGLLRASGVL